MRKVNKESMDVIDNDFYILSKEEIEILEAFARHKKQAKGEERTYSVDNEYENVRTWAKFKTIDLK